ncbi:DUF3572 domain-containing protein [Microvirga sp. W0021]|uniref:DUF3572 domain-containing protein n=1 Tax=Hohaiivirga grylli TaxID=3133970 RepID=A0ABV0BIF9_9HYPH
MVEPDDIALKILNALAIDPERLGRFIDMTGLRADTIREATRRKEFWIALYDYIASDEPLLLAIAAEIGEKPESIIAAQQRLSPPEHFE